MFGGDIFAVFTFAGGDRQAVPAQGTCAVTVTAPSAALTSAAPSVAVVFAAPTVSVTID